MEVINSNIQVTPVQQSRLDEVDMNAIPFGRIFSDHMLVVRYTEGRWQSPTIVPYGPMSLAPSSSVLNYGQAIFEGMKATRGHDGQIRFFRPEQNLRRLNQSAERMCMPPLPEETFMEGLKALIHLDRNWVPSAEQGSLYIRPVMFATDEFIGVKASDDYIFTIFTSPVGPYYTQPVSLLASKDHVRAALGGTGAAKFAGNYAAALLPDQLAKEKGYHNVMWLAPRENRFIEECGTMNIFFVIDGTVVTPALSGTILPGITRRSLLTLLRDQGYAVEERRVSIYEIEGASREGRLEEAFGVGTAATVSPVERIGFAGRDIVLPPVEDFRVGNWLKEQLQALKVGEAEDRYGWTVQL